MQAIRLNVKQTLQAGLAILALPLIAACSPVGFTQAPEKTVNADGTGVTPGDTCTDVGSIQRLTKIIFVVDTSGSNRFPSRPNANTRCFEDDADIAQCTPATDPTKAFRGGAIQRFFTQYQSKTNFNWSFLTFAGSNARSLINSSGYIASDASQMQAAIDGFYNVGDDGGTPYGAGLRMAKQVIQNDGDRNSSASPQYVVVLISDGFPTDYTLNNGNFDSIGLQQDISSLLAAAPGRVSLSTIYYSQVQDTSARGLLQSMAAEGKGQFANVNDTSSGINIDDVIPGSVCNQ